MNNAPEPSDAMRFLYESKELNNVFYKSPSDFFSLLTGIGDTAQLSLIHMNKSFIWNAGNFTLINDSRNTIRIHSLLHFISFGSPVVHMLFMSAFSLIGLRHLSIAVANYSKLKPLILFSVLLLFPSLLFWSSGILKEPFMVLGLGLILRFLLVNDPLKKRFIIGVFGILILTLFKPYIFICLIPAVLFYVIYKYVFKQIMILCLLSSFITLLVCVVLFSSKRKLITEYLSRKQFDMENVGEGGLHVYVNNNFYYFKPHQYKNLKIENDTVKLIHPSDAFFLSGDLKEVPKLVHLTEIGQKWKIHIVMPGTNSYIKTTSIDNSFTQLIENIPEALGNVFFRPLPIDKGSFLIYPAMLEVWILFFILLISIIFHRKLDSKSKGLITSFLLFAIGLMLLIGWTTPIIGAIVRFRFPSQLALLIIALITIDSKKISKRITHE